MKIVSLEKLVDRINQDLGIKFIDNFRYKRKSLGNHSRATSSGILFKFIDKDRDWVINEGGGAEVQYHLFLHNDVVGYGLGFNAQYVPFANAMSSVDYIKPFVNAFLKLKNDNDLRIRTLLNNGFSLVEGDWASLNNIQNREYYLFGKTIDVDNGDIKDNEYHDMISDLKNGLFDLYVAIWEQKNKMENNTEVMEKYINLLNKNFNLVLTGAPGTGKTYLAKQIAQQMILGNVKENLADNEQKQFDEQCGFVQFHPSYDYTDFIEGLRPKQYSGGNIGFEIKDGVFKKFCTKVIKDSYSDSTDNFEEVWRNFVKDLSVSGIQIPTTTGYGKPFTVVLNQNGDGLVDVQSTYNRYYNYEQLYNVYRGLPGVPNGGHDNYRQAVIKYLKQEYRLKDYKIGKKTDTDKKFIFIIDEINRGEISKIFGELFFSIDPGYRGKNGEVKTQYANMYETPNEFDNELGITDTHDYGHFFVPKNVYIIGTMNDIDRSVESMDFAFRRRFAFKEIKAKETQYMLDSEEAWGKDNNNKSLKPKDDIVQKVKNRMNNLNDMIWHEPIENESNDIKSIEGFSSAYHIGASYFLKLANYKNDDGSYDFDKLWDYHLDGLLHEYLRGMDDVDNKIDRLKQAYKNDNA